MLDHGILNLPLSKRGSGSIDAQLDRYKWEKAKADKAQARAYAIELKERREEAKAIIAALPEEKIMSMAESASMTVRQAEKWLKSKAHWEPRFIIRILGGAK